MPTRTLTASGSPTFSNTVEGMVGGALARSADVNAALQTLLDNDAALEQSLPVGLASGDYVVHSDGAGAITYVAITFAGSTSLAALAALTASANSVPYFTGSTTASTFTSTAGGRALVGVTGATNKGVYFTSSSAVATFDLTTSGRALGGLTGVSDTAPYFDSGTTASTYTITASGRSLVAVNGTADKSVYFNGTATAALYTLTAAGRDMVGAANVAAQKTLLGAGAANGLATLDSSVRVVEPTAYTPATSANWATTAPVSDVSALDKLAALLGPARTNTFTLPTTASMMTHGQTISATDVDAAGTSRSRYMRIWRPNTAPPSFSISAAGKLTLTWNSSMSSQDIYSNGSLNGPGISFALHPGLFAQLKDGTAFYLYWTAAIDKPTSFNSAGEWSRPLGMFYGPCANDVGVRSWYMAFMEANTGNYQVGGTYCIGAAGGSHSITTTTSANLITGLDMYLKLSHDGQCTFGYRVTGSGSGYTASSGFAYNPGFWPNAAFLGFGMGAVDAGAGTCTQTIYNISIGIS